MKGVFFNIFYDTWAEEVFRQMKVVVFYVYFLPVNTGHPTSGLQAKFILMCTLGLSTLLLILKNLFRSDQTL